MRLQLLAALLALSITADGVRALNLNRRTRREDEVIPDEAAPPVASAPAGDFEGFWTKSRSGRPIASFEGIPYAQPPIGKLRFQSAEPPPKLTGFQAKQPASPCVQRQIMLLSDTKVLGDEDCLYLNVYVPEKVGRLEDEQLPVIFFIHGGGFVRGRGSDARPTYVLDKDVVFVTVDYRLGPLGFLTTGDGVIPDNLALRDQIAALQWVKENIAGFGGNPNLVTVMGHSAGSVCAEHLLLSPLAKDLFHRVISLSGSSLAPWAVNTEEEAAKTREKYAEHLGCPPEPSENLLECLLAKPAHEIVAAEFIFKRFSEMPVRPFFPVAGIKDNAAVLPILPRLMYEEGLFNDVPVISGVTNGEGACYTNGIFNNENLVEMLNHKLFMKLSQMLGSGKLSQEEIEKIFTFYFGSMDSLSKTHFMNATNLLTDDLFLWPMIQSERYRKITAKSPTYIYYFGYEGGKPLMAGGRESVVEHVVVHGGIGPYLFPTSTNLTGDDELLSIAMVDLFTSFARDGAPSTNAIDIQWDPVTSKESDIEYLHIDTISDIKMKKDLLPERWGLWDQLERDRAT